jgi:hypothetical protein
MIPDRSFPSLRGSQNQRRSTSKLPIGKLLEIFLLHFIALARRCVRIEGKDSKNEPILNCRRNPSPETELEEGFNQERLEKDNRPGINPFWSRVGTQSAPMSPGAIMHAPPELSARFDRLLTRREVALFCARLVSPVIAIKIDAAEGAVILEVGRCIGQRILAAQLFLNVLEAV